MTTSVNSISHSFPALPAFVSTLEAVDDAFRVERFRLDLREGKVAAAVEGAGVSETRIRELRGAMRPYGEAKVVNKDIFTKRVEDFSLPNR